MWVAVCCFALYYATVLGALLPCIISWRRQLPKLTLELVMTLQIAPITSIQRLAHQPPAFVRFPMLRRRHPSDQPFRHKPRSDAWKPSSDAQAPAISTADHRRID